jgi:tight adherence protein C
MTPLFYFCFAATVFCALGILMAHLLTRRSRATTRRIRAVAQRGRRGELETAISDNLGRRFFTAVQWLRSRLGMADEEDLTQRLADAGYRGTFPAEVYNTARILCPVIAFVVGSFIPAGRIFWMVALPAVTFIAPSIVLSRLIRRRRESIRKSIPDAIDLLVICVDAGLGIDQALLRVGQELGISHPQITEELLQINREQRAGKPRVQAWTDMAARSKLKDIDAFANMLLQTERFGTPIARALSIFSDTIRLKRRQRAEEMAAKTTVKIVFPLVFFIFPSIFIVLLAPAILGIIHGMAAVGQ